MVDTGPVKVQERARRGLTAQRYAQLVEQRRYELTVNAGGLAALLLPYAVTSCALRVPSQRRGGVTD